tara:strand:+ start:6778 stop:7191 length:414 start_codon:yes stop_codon:yes gene_type:complete
MMTNATNSTKGSVRPVKSSASKIRHGQVPAKKPSIQKMRHVTAKMTTATAKSMTVSLAVSVVLLVPQKNATQAIRATQARGSAQRAHRLVNPTLLGALAKTMSNQKLRSAMAKTTTVTDKQTKISKRLVREIVENLV